jgi:hypothetical protein
MPDTSSDVVRIYALIVAHTYDNLRTNLGLSGASYCSYKSTNLLGSPVTTANSASHLADHASGQLTVQVLI